MSRGRWGISLVRAIVLFILFALPAEASQGGKENDPTSSEQAEVDQAVNTLKTKFNYTIPDGYVVKAAKLPGSLLGETKPIRKIIYLDVEKINALLLTENPGSRGTNDDVGPVLGVLFHELQHATGDYSDSPCDEAELRKTVAAWWCEVICMMVAINGPEYDLCDMYAIEMNTFNNVIKPLCAADCPQSDMAECSCCEF